MIANSFKASQIHSKNLKFILHIISNSFKASKIEILICFVFQNRFSAGCSRAKPRDRGPLAFPVDLPLLRVPLFVEGRTSLARQKDSRRTTVHLPGTIYKQTDRYIDRQRDKQTEPLSYVRKTAIAVR
jgi:hypothetical protein